MKVNTNWRIRMSGFAPTALAIAGCLAFGAATLPAPDVLARQATPLASPTATDETFTIGGQVDTPLTLSVADLRAMPAETAEVTFLSGQGEQAHAYTGVLLATLIDQAGMQLDPERKNDQLRKYLVITAKDSYEVVLAWGELDPEFANTPVLVAYEEDGAPLTGEDGPVRLVVPGDAHGGRYVSGVVSIEVRDVDSDPRAD